MHLDMYNLNKGKNEKLLAKCRSLADYMELLNRININLENDDIKTSVNKAVESCIKDGVLVEVLTAHRAEVLDMCITEYNEKSFVKGIREEGREEGRSEGHNEGVLTTLVSLATDGLISIKEEAKRAGMTENEFLVQMKKM